jgi:hypothetical protein
VCSPAARKATIRVRVLRGHKLLAAKGANLAHKRLQVVVRRGSKLKKGRYTLKITLTQRARTSLVLTRQLRVR